MKFTLSFIKFSYKIILYFGILFEKLIILHFMEMHIPLKKKVLFLQN